MCEWKGVASYFDFVNKETNTVIQNVAWMYEKPTSGFKDIDSCLSFYASLLDQCFVNKEKVIAQEGDYYGGWKTANLVGPFKGGPGTIGW